MAKVKSDATMSASQIAIQRRSKNTRFGEIVRINAKTGQTVADQIRIDIFEGSTARARRFLQFGLKYEKKYGLNTVGYYRLPNGSHRKEPLMPIISIKDDYLRGYKGREQPYEMLPWEDPRYIAKEKLFEKFGIDFGSMSRQIIGYIYPMNTPGWAGTYGKQYKSSPKIRKKYPTEQEYYDFLIKYINIPPFGSEHWEKYYQRSWRENIKNCCSKRNPDGSCIGAYDRDPTDAMKKFCDEYPTEKIYHDKLVKEKEEVWKKNDVVSDIHFGLFATPKTLDEENVAALLYTLYPVISVAQTFGVSVGSFQADYKFSDWNFSRRYGVADKIKYPPGIKEPKVGHSGYEIIASPNKTIPAFSDGDPIDSSFAQEHKGNGGSAQSASTFMELRVQVASEVGTDKPMYVCMRLYNPLVTQKIDTPLGSKGKSARIYKDFRLIGIDDQDADEKYADGMAYPLSYESIRMVKIFKRDRLLRETSIVLISIIQQVKLKWYQTGWGKVLMIFVAVVFTFFTYGATMKFVLALVKMVLVTIAIQILSKVIKNKFLLAILQVAAMIYFGNIDTNSFMQNAVLLVEATGTLYQGYVLEEMIKMQEKYEEFQKTINAKREEIKKLEKEAGMNEQRKEFLRYLASLPPYETADDFFSRVQNEDLNESDYNDRVLETHLED